MMTPRWLPVVAGVGIAALGEAALRHLGAGSQTPSQVPDVPGQSVDEVGQNVAQSVVGLAAAERASPPEKHRTLNRP